MNQKEQKELLDSIDKLLDRKFEAKFNEIQIQLNKIPEIEKQVAKIPEMQKEIVETRKEIVETREQVAETQKQVEETQKQVEETQKQVAEIQKETRKISGSVAVIEHEHGDKLKALFDAFTVNNEHIQMEEKRISLCEVKVENHDMEIDYLKTKVQGL